MASRRRPAILTLTTDFGLSDPYVGAMKGVALSVNPEIRFVDLTHDVPAQDVLAGALALEAAAAYFPAGTVHLAVVDPGVGSKRRAIAVAAGGHVLVGPDNGLLSLAWRRLGSGGTPRAVSLERSRYFREPLSATFHGRDLFAPVAAHCTLSTEIGEFGPAIENPIVLDLPAPRKGSEGSLRGEVIAVDRFGNLVTNISRPALSAAFASGAPKSVRVAGRSLPAPFRTYSDIGPGAIGALFGSTDRLEISVGGGSAAKELAAGRGAEVEVR